MPNLSKEQELVLGRFKVANMRAEVNNIVDLVTRDAFIDRVKAVLKAPPADQLKLASQTLTPAALKAAGLPIKDDTRVSSRYFEESSKRSSVLGTGAASAMPISIPHDVVDPRLAVLRQKLGPNTNVSIQDANASVCVCVGGGACVGVGGG
jgi:hypothetical protein